MNEGIFGGRLGFSGSSGRTKLTVLTEGSGTFYPIKSNVFIRVILVGAGGIGGTSSNQGYDEQLGQYINIAAGGGGGGATIIKPYFITGSVNYSIGISPATIASTASGTAFGSLYAPGGGNGNSGQGYNGAYNYGPLSGNPGGWTSLTVGSNIFGDGLCGGYGGGYSLCYARDPGQVIPLYTFYTSSSGPGMVGTGGAWGIGGPYSSAGSGGGSSMYGIGGVGGAYASVGQNATGYGAGGGGGGAGVPGPSSDPKVGGLGTGGLIIIEEF